MSSGLTPVMIISWFNFFANIYIWLAVHTCAPRVRSYYLTQHKPSCDLTIFFRQYDAVCDKLRRSMSFSSSLHSGFSLKAVWATTISFWGILSSWKKRYCKHSAEFIFNKHLLKMNSNKVETILKEREVVFLSPSNMPSTFEFFYCVPEKFKCWRHIAGW